jgi:phospho-N-acetylmuramoyl-pentapeptide-transferase
VLYHLFVPLEDAVSGFHIFRYVSFRAAFAAVLAFLVATVVGPGIVATLRARKIAGTALTGSGAVDERRLAKRDVPTMGGVILLAGVTLSSLLLARLDVLPVWVALVSFLAFGAIGAADDWRKLTVAGSPGMSERRKLALQVAVALAAMGVLYVDGSREDGRPLLRGPSVQPSPYARPWVRRHEVVAGDTFASLAGRYLGDEARAGEVAAANHRTLEPGAAFEALPVGRAVEIPAPWPRPGVRHRTDLQVPFFKHVCVDLGLLFLPLAILVIVGASNAVNLTDGLDGLAIGCTATVAAALTVVAYVVSRHDFARDFHQFHVPDAAELAVVGAALGGGSLGFLWFNGWPGTVFMGDTGSLAIGGILGVLAVAVRHELTLFLAGGVFVAEALSVLWQRAWFKGTRRAARRRGDPQATGKRWFRCAPLHHHFEQGGLHENKVTVRLWIVSVVCALLALATLKLR